MTVYLDTSSLVKLFVAEEQSGAVRSLVEAATVVFSSQVAYPEARASLARRRREGSLTTRQLTLARGSFEAKWGDLLVIPVSDGLCREAGDLAERYQLRGFDSIHLASFAEMLRGLQGRDEVEFSSFDDRLNAAARRLARTIK